MKIKHYIICFLLILFSTISFAQPKIKYTTKSKDAIKKYETATKYFDARQNSDAERELHAAIKLDEKFVEAHMLLGDVYTDSHFFDQAINEYKRAIEINQYFFPKNYFLLAKNELFIGLYQDAKGHFEEYLKIDDVDVANQFRVNKFIKQCDFGIYQLAHSIPFEPKNLGPNINSKYSEYFPAVTADDSILLFTRNVFDSLNPKRSQEDFYMSYRDTVAWKKSFNIGPPVNTEMNEGAPAYSPDGQFIIFTACEKYGEYGNGRTGYGSCDFFITYRTGNTWTVPENMGVPINTNAWETQPSVSSDGKTLYFIRKYKGNQEQSDIWTSTRDDNWKWSVPVKLNNKVNSDMREESVFIHPDNQTLYFSSEGHLGMGGFDIFMSRRDSSGDWGEPINLGYPINTCGNENSILLNANGDLAYFASDRKGGYGRLDLYSFEVYEKIRPIAVNYFKGIIFDEQTKVKLEARFDLTDLKTGKLIVQSFSDPVTGSFLICLPTENDYALNAFKDGYLFYSENFSLSGVHSAKEPFLKNIALKPIKEGEIGILKNIFFDTDKYELKPESKTELDKLVNLLIKNPSLKIEIGGHTDNVGDEKYNLTLSQNRAKSVCDYLIQNKIAKERLKYVGYGESKPIETNETELGRANNRRTEFKVIGK